MPFIGNIGAPELIIILIIALIVLGPGKLPDVAQALGKSVREFRKAATDISEAASLEPTKSPTPNLPATNPSPEGANTLSSATQPNQLADPPAPTPVGSQPDGENRPS